MIHRKTFSLDENLDRKIINLEAKLIKQTQHHWSDSKVISSLLRYALDHGANATTIARIFDEK